MLVSGPVETEPDEPEGPEGMVIGVVPRYKESPVHPVVLHESVDDPPEATVAGERLKELMLQETGTTSDLETIPEVELLASKTYEGSTEPPPKEPVRAPVEIEPEKEELIGVSPSPDR